MHSCVGSVTVTDSSVPVLCRTYGFWEKPAILCSIQIDAKHHQSIAKFTSRLRKISIWFASESIIQIRPFK